MNKKVQVSRKVFEGIEACSRLEGRGISAAPTRVRDCCP